MVVPVNTHTKLNFSSVRLACGARNQKARASKINCDKYPSVVIRFATTPPTSLDKIPT